jgi:anti-sigma factor RsiW
MTEHVTQWLEAYYDGELKGRRVQQVEAHLETCEICMAELENLSSLSALLQEFPEARNLTPVDTFTAQVGLRLPRKPEESKRNRFFQVSWQWVPVGLLTTWLFVQTAFFVSGVITWAFRVIPGLDQFSSILQSDTQTGAISGALSDLSNAGFAEIGQFGLSIFRGGGPLGWAVTLNLVLTFILGLLYLSWLASWWVQKPNGEKSSA